MEINYLKHKIRLYGEIKNRDIENIAKLYFIGLGFNAYNTSEEKEKILITYPKLNKLFLDCKGMPDLLIEKDNNLTFVEIKTSLPKYDDSLRESQLKWINEHPNHRVVVLFLEVEFNPDQCLLISSLRQKIKELIEENNKLRLDFFSYNRDDYEKVKGEIYKNLDEFLNKIKYRELDTDKERLERDKRLDYGKERPYSEIPSKNIYNKNDMDVGI